MWRISAIPSAVRRVERPPIGQGVDVEILAVDGDAFLEQELRDVVDHPGPGVGMAQVENTVGVVRQADQPFGVLPVETGSFIDPLRLEPEDEALAFVSGRVADRLEAAREPLLVGRPGADSVPPACARVFVPSGVDPERFGLEAELAEPVDHGQGVAFGGAGVFVAGGRPAEADAVGEGRLDELAVRPRRVMGQDEAAQQVVAVEPVGAFPKEQAHRRRADFLPRMQAEMGRLHARLEGDFRLAGLLDRGFPAAGPADGGHDTPAGGGDIEEGQGRVGGSAASSPEGDFRAVGQDVDERAEVGPQGVASPGPIEGRRAGGPVVEAQSRNEDVLDDRRIGAALVLEADDPFDRRIVCIQRVDDGHPELRGRVGNRRPSSAF